MLLTALSNYLQHQPASTSASAEAAPTAAIDAVGANESPWDYRFSDRAILVNAVAAEFDVTTLNEQQTQRFQERLQQYGLLQGLNLNALAIINTARAETPQQDINALALVDQAVAEFDQNGTPYPQRQQTKQLQTLLHNLASARPAKAA
ncbi:MAG: hypothetical protein IBX52_04385 [Bacterioplanes sp.]|nr:hypothetical protein [Bacterioplanes sp.]